MTTKKVLLVLCLVNFYGMVIADGATEQTINLAEELKRSELSGFQKLAVNAALNKKMDLVRKILVEEKDNITDPREIIVYGILSGNDSMAQEIVELIVETQPDFDINHDGVKWTRYGWVFGETSLIKALYYKSKLAATAILDNGGDVNLQYASKTPLKYAVESRFVKGVELCLERGAHLGGIRDAYSNNLLRFNEQSLRYFLMNLQLHRYSTEEGRESISNRVKECQAIKDMLIGAMVEKSAEVECPFSGILR